MIELSQNGWPHSTSPFKDNPPANSVGIVVPVRDGLKFFKLCFYSVTYFTDHPYMLTVVDNLSGLKTKKYLLSLVQNHAVNVLRFDEPFNFAAQVNQGLRHVFTFPGVKFGLILNADTVVEPEWLSKLVGTIARVPELGIVGPVSNFALREQQRLRGSTPEMARRISGFCMLMRREVFEGIGGFDEQFQGGGFEDWDFCLRAQEAGWNCLIDPRVYVHHFGKAFRRSQEDDLRMRTNKELFFKKHPEIEKLVVKEPVDA